MKMNVNEAHQLWHDAMTGDMAQDENKFLFPRFKQTANMILPKEATWKDVGSFLRLMADRIEQGYPGD